MCSDQISAVVLEDDVPEPPVINMLPSSRRMEDAPNLAWVMVLVFDHVPASYFRHDFSWRNLVYDDVTTPVTEPPQTIMFPLIIWAMGPVLPSGRSLTVGQSEFGFNGLKLSTEDKSSPSQSDPPIALIMGTGDTMRI